MQVKKHIYKLKLALGEQNTNDDDAPNDSTYNNETTPTFDKLPDCYLCEGSLDKMMIEALNKLILHDLNYFLMETESSDKPFKKNVRHHPNTIQNQVMVTLHILYNLTLVAINSRVST